MLNTIGVVASRASIKTAVTTHGIADPEPCGFELEEESNIILNIYSGFRDRNNNSQTTDRIAVF